VHKQTDNFTFNLQMTNKNLLISITGHVNQHTDRDYIWGGGGEMPTKKTKKLMLRGVTIRSSVYVKFPDTSEDKTIHTKGKDNYGIQAQTGKALRQNLDFHGSSLMKTVLNLCSV
jgi:hypothetical protein